MKSLALALIVIAILIALLGITAQAANPSAVLCPSHDSTGRPLSRSHVNLDTNTLVCFYGTRIEPSCAITENPVRMRQRNDTLLRCAYKLTED
jgi:hypothetical protein